MSLATFEALLSSVANLRSRPPFITATLRLLWICLTSSSQGLGPAEAAELLACGESMTVDSEVRIRDAANGSTDSTDF